MENLRTCSGDKMLSILIDPFAFSRKWQEGCHSSGSFDDVCAHFRPPDSPLVDPSVRFCTLIEKPLADCGHVS